MATRKFKAKATNYNISFAARLEKIRATFGHPPCRTLRDMTEPEIRALERTYGCPVIRPA